MVVFEFIGEHFLGTLVNFAVVLLTGILGTLIKRGIPERFTKIIMAAMAICVIYIGITGVLEAVTDANRAEGDFLSAGLFKILVMIISMAVGAVIGELIDLDKQMTRLGALLGKIFTRRKSGKEELDEDERSKRAKRFAEGFVSCSMLFCVGAMAVQGALNDAAGDPSLLLAKTVIDGIVCFVMSTTLGIGCAFSAFFVLLYQGVFNCIGLALAELPASTLGYMSVTGSLIIILIGTNTLGVTKVKTMNLVPAMFAAIGVEALLNLIF